MYYVPGPVTVTELGYAEVILYFNNVTMNGVDQVLNVYLVHTDPENGVNVETTSSTVTLEPVGKN